MQHPGNRRRGDRGALFDRSRLTEDTFLSRARLVSLSRHVIKRQVNHAVAANAARASKQRGHRCSVDSTWRRIYRFMGRRSKPTAVALAGSKVAHSLVPRLSRVRAPRVNWHILGSFIIISTEVRSLISNWTSGSHRENKGEASAAPRIGRAESITLLREFAGTLSLGRRDRDLYVSS